MYQDQSHSKQACTEDNLCSLKDLHCFTWSMVSIQTASPTLFLQVLNKNTAQQLAAARAEADRVKTALQAAEKQLAAKDDRIASLHADLHILDAQKDELKHAVADASGAVLSASDNSSALEARVRTLLAQLKDRDEVEAVLKEQLSSLQV